MRRLSSSSEDGYILVFTLLLLVVLTLLGVSAIDTSIFESNMSANDALYKRAFYQADGGAELGIQLAYENAICSTVKQGFTKNFGELRLIGDSVVVTDLVFAQNKDENLYKTPPVPLAPSDSNRHAAFYPGAKMVPGAATNDSHDAEPNTNLLFSSRTIEEEGSGTIAFSGYPGLGVSQVGATSKEYTIASQHQGARRSESLVTITWKLGNHMLNSASSFDCKY